MKITIIVKDKIQKSTKEQLNDIASMIEELSKSHPNTINKNDVEVTITD